MATRYEVPPTKNKKGAKSIEQRLRNSKVEVAKIEKHCAIFEQAGIYELSRIDQFLAVNWTKEICHNISRVLSTENTLYLSVTSRKIVQSKIR